MPDAWANSIRINIRDIEGVMVKRGGDALPTFTEVFVIQTFSNKSGQNAIKYFFGCFGVRISKKKNFLRSTIFLNISKISSFRKQLPYMVKLDAKCRSKAYNQTQRRRHRESSFWENLTPSNSTILRFWSPSNSTISEKFWPLLPLFELSDPDPCIFSWS